MKCLTDSKRAEQGKQSLLGSQFVYIGVLSNDFADVDVREELCYHSRPKKQKSEGYATKERNGRVIWQRESVTR